MHPKLDFYWRRFEKLRADICRELSALTPNQFSQRLFENKWSVSELMAHLITSERLSVRYLKKKMLGMETAGRTGWWADAKMVVLQISQRLPLKFKAPKRVVAETPSYQNVEVMLADWKAVRKEMETILETFSEKDIDKKIYRHIIAGRLNIVHAVRFLNEHILHHRPQLDRLLKKHQAVQIK